MALNEFAEGYDALSPEQRVSFLIQLMKELTILARGCYSPSPQVVNSGPGSTVGNINEMQHRLAAILYQVTTGDSSSVTGMNVVSRLVDRAEAGRFEEAFVWSLEQALSSATRTG